MIPESYIYFRFYVQARKPSLTIGRFPGFLYFSLPEKNLLKTQKDISLRIEVVRYSHFNGRIRILQQIDQIVSITIYERNGAIEI